MRYFIGYTFSAAENALIEPLRQEIAQRFSVQAAIRIPPHITVLRPFETKVPIERLRQSIEGVFAQALPADIRVIGFASFDRGVWFLDVDQAQAMRETNRALADMAYRLYQTKPDRPIESTYFHLTLAYKDVAPDTFERIGAFLKAQPLPIARLNIRTATLFMDKDGRWEPLATYGIGP